MRVSNDEKRRSRARILDAAGRRLREGGIAGASVSDIMKDAGMTHGGFYKHFEDKGDLVRAALADAFERFVGRLAQAEDEAALDEFRRLYLSREHRNEAGQGCPIAALGPEVARTDATTRRVMTAGAESMIGQFERFRANATDTRKAAIRELAALVGALVIARSVEDPLSEEVLAALRAAPESEP